MALRGISFAAIFASLVLVLAWTVFKWTGTPAAMAAQARARAASLLDAWASLAHERNNDGTTFGYGREPGVSKTLLHEVLEPGLEIADARERRFRAPRSFRDVEPAVLLRKVAPNGAEIE